MIISSTRTHNRPPHLKPPNNKPVGIPTFANQDHLPFLCLLVLGLHLLYSNTLPWYMCSTKMFGSVLAGLVWFDSSGH